MDFEKLGKLIDQWKALLTGIGLLLGAAVAIRKALIDLDPAACSWPEISLAAVSALVLTLVAVRSRKRHVSRLVDPDALKLDPQSPEQLVGRREDLDKLLRALTNPLVFLVSESGCGKSALLRAGVAQGPAFLQRFLPIYIDMSVLDWEDGALRAVREGFAQALPNDDPARGKLDAHGSPRQYAEAFGEYYRRTQRRPLLLLDQFDDYQADPRHRERFLPPETRVWRNADAIARENAFWRMLRQCLQNDSVSIIVTCREDAAQGLESLRFHPDVPQFDLPRLEPGLVRLIIDRLTERPADEPAVIAEPEGGWAALRDRVADDLEARGQVLPQQLKVVLGGLRTLRRLTPAAYARGGRLAGLEAAFVAGAITRAARTAALRDEDVLRLLLPLIDRTRQPPDKGPPQSARRLAETAGVPEQAASRALERLEADESVRPRGEFQDAVVGWQLYHAYLAQPILRIERERDQWRRLLQERARAYTEASWRDKWNAFLPLGMQVRLLGARLQQRFRYGEQSGYALKSLSRVTPAVAALGLIAGLISAAIEWDTAGQIESEMAGNDDPMSDDAAAGLAQLSVRSWVTRWRMAHDIFYLPQHAQWFAAAPGPVIRAWARLNPDRLDDLVQAYVTPEALRQSDQRLKAAALALIGQTSVAALTDETRTAFEQTVGGALSDPATAAAGAPVLASALSNGDPRTASLLATLREAIGKTAHSDELEALAQAYAAMARKLKQDDPHAAEELAALREAIGEPRFPYQHRTLAQAYAAVAGELKEADPHSGEILAGIREAIGKTTNYFQLGALAQAYAAVAGKLKEADPHAAGELAALREAIDNTTDEFQLSALAQAYMAVAGKLKEADPRAAKELAALREAIGKTTDDFQLSALAQAYGAVAEQVKEADPDAAEVLTALREAIGGTSDSGQLSVLAQAYAAVAEQVKEADSHAAEVLVALREAIGKTTIPYQLTALGQAYTAVAGKLKPADPHAAEDLTALREAIGKATDPFQLSALAQAYAAVAGELKEPDPHAAGALAGLREAIGKSTNHLQLSASVQAYAAVADELKEADPHAAEELAGLREAAAKTTNPDQLWALAQAYAAVTKKARLATPPVQDIAVLLEKIGDVRSADQCEAFAAAILAALRLGSRPLTWDQAGLVVAAVLLQPISAGEPTRELVRGYEEFLRGRSDAPKPAETWAGDVWAFANWARKNLPGFDPHRPNVAFLPSVSLVARQ